MSQLDFARLDPAYNGSALTASLLTAPYWAKALTASATEGPLAPLGLTVAALIATWWLDHAQDRQGRRLRWWVPRVLLWTAAVTGPAYSVAARPAVLDFLIGLHP